MSNVTVVNSSDPQPPVLPFEKRSSDQLVDELIAQALVAGPLVRRKNIDWFTVRQSVIAMYEKAIRIQEVRYAAHR